MSDVRLDVGGRRYTVACADGQEDSVRHLASLVDAKLAEMGANLSSNEAKNLLFAALLLADDLEEAKKQAATSPSSLPAATPVDTDAIAVRLDRLAIALENTASRLESEQQAS